jgi:tetratricopeptide (TPR) repeat protein
LSAALWLVCAGCGPPDPVERARELQATGRPAESLEQLRELVESGAEDPEIFYLYGMALLGAGQHGLAQWPLRRAMENPEWLARSGLAVANLAIGTGNYDEAIETLGRVLEAEPDHVGALNLRSIARCYSRRDYEGALADAERALELEPDNAELLVPRAVALMGLMRVEEAEAALDELDRRARDESLSPEIAAIHCTARASFRKEKREPDEADRIYQECLGRYPTAAVLVQDSVEFYDSRGRPDRSLEILRAAYDADRTSRGYRLTLAARLDMAGARAEAERILREATEVEDPALAAVAWADLAGFYLGGGAADLAVSAYERAIAGPGDPLPDLLFGYAEALILAGRHEKALDVAATMKVAAHRELVRARVELERGQPRRALDLFTEGLRLWPDNAVARYYAARAAEQVGDFDRAIEEYRGSIRSEARSTDARVRLARLHLAEGSPELALVVVRHDAFNSATPETLLLELEILASRGNVARLPEHIERQVRTPAMWPRAVAAIAAGTRRRAGAEAAAERVRRERLDLTHPVNAPALRELIVSLLEAGQARAALDLADAAVQAHAETAAFHELRGLALAGGAGEASEARAAYERALERQSDNVGALAGLARLAAESGDTATALDLYAAAAAVGADDASPLVSSAELLASLGRAGEAEARLAEALKRSPYDGEAALRLAELQLARGSDPASARRLLERAVRFGAGGEAEALLERAKGPQPTAGLAAEAR